MNLKVLHRADLYPLCWNRDNIVKNIATAIWLNTRSKKHITYYLTDKGLLFQNNNPLHVKIVAQTQPAL